VVPILSFIFFYFNARLARIHFLLPSPQVNEIRKIPMRDHFSFAAIADGTGLKWDCWPKGTGWKYGSDFGFLTFAIAFLFP
jgi:hypothetical protein